jgi:hypothetical protein
MPEELNYYVDFRADFLALDADDEAHGPELAQLLADELSKHDIAVRTFETHRDRFIQCSCGVTKIGLSIGPELFEGQGDRWFIQLCGKRSFLGREQHPESDCRKLLVAIGEILNESDRVFDIRWYPYFELLPDRELIKPSAGPLRETPLDEQLHPLSRLERKLSRIDRAFFGPLGCTLWLVSVVIFSKVAPELVASIMGGFGGLGCFVSCCFNGVVGFDQARSETHLGATTVAAVVLVSQLAPKAKEAADLCCGVLLQTASESCRIIFSTCPRILPIEHQGRQNAPGRESPLVATRSAVGIPFLLDGRCRVRGRCDHHSDWLAVR